MAFQRRASNPPGVFRHPGFTRIVTTEGPSRQIFIAGQTPTDDEYRCVAPGDMRAQYLRVMELLTLQLAAAGATWDDVTFQRIFTLDVDEYIRVVTEEPDLPEYWDEELPPPATLVGVTRLSQPEFLLEIDLHAVVAAGPS